MVELEWVEQIKTLEVRPNDVVVVRCNRLIPDSTYRIIVQKMRTFFPHNKIVLLEDNMDIGVMRQSK